MPPLPPELWDQTPPVIQGVLLVISEGYERRITALEDEVAELKEQARRTKVDFALSILARQCLARRNAVQATIDWRFSVEDARQKLHRLYPSQLMRCTTSAINKQLMRPRRVNSYKRDTPQTGDVTRRSRVIPQRVFC
jgi:hypothetical protein